MNDCTRSNLIDICERSVVPESEWCNRDSAEAQMQIGQAWSLLKAGCEYTVLSGDTEKEWSLKTDDETIWIEIRYRGFAAFEYGEESMESDNFYLPTQKRLDRSIGRDWY